MELVDFNEVVMNDKAIKTEAKKTTRRSRAKAPKASDVAAEETTTESAE
jgi:hypothetical protein